MSEQSYRTVVRFAGEPVLAVVRTRVIAALCALCAACASPTAPTVSYAGQWAGSTAQGESIAFTISADEVVTAITVGYAFNDCRGSQAFPNLNLSITPQVTCIPGPCSGPVSAYRGFSFQAGTVIQEPMTQVNGILFGGVGAQGTVNFRDYTGCGSATGVAWNATKR
jgi:hypothetical protein